MNVNPLSLTNRDTQILIELFPELRAARRAIAIIESDRLRQDLFRAGREILLADDAGVGLVWMGARLVASEKRPCKVTTRSGRGCHFAAAYGSDVCPMHGGEAPGRPSRDEVAS